MFLHSDIEYVIIEKGGPGSGYPHHPGRRGKRGGSMSRRDAMMQELAGKIDDEINRMKTIYRHDPQRQEAIEALRPVMRATEEWAGRMLELDEAEKTIAQAMLAIQFITSGEEKMWVLSELGTEVHQPRSRDLHVDPGGQGAKVVQLPGGISNFVLGLEDSNGKRAVYKLGIGERERIRSTIAAGTSAGREVAVSRIADILGLTGNAEGYSGWRVAKSDFINDGVEGSVTEWVEEAPHDEDEAEDEDDVAKHAVDISSLSDETLREIALFDMLIGNTDRHCMNLMMDTDGKVVAIDHGLALSPNLNVEWANRAPLDHVSERHAEDWMAGKTSRSDQWDISETERQMAQTLLEHEEELMDIAQETGVPMESIEAVFRRAEKVVESSTWDELLGELWW